MVFAPDDPGRFSGTAPDADEAALGEDERPARPAQREPLALVSGTAWLDRGQALL